MYPSLAAGTLRRGKLIKIYAKRNIMAPIILVAVALVNRFAPAVVYLQL
jgi:hypothetical protein